MITYLLYILPFRKFIDSEYIDDGYLFPDTKSKYGHWDTARQTRILVRETKSQLGFAMRTSDWRQIQVALDRRFIHTNYEHVMDEDEYEDDIHDLQAVHSTKVAKIKYGNTGTWVDSTTSSMFQHLSGKFHAWYHLVSRPPRDDFIESQKRFIRTIPSEANIQRGLNQLHGNGTEFNSIKHREAMNVILAGKTPVVTIFPTGSGKTDFVLLPAVLYPEKTFVVITPYVALANEFEKRCNDLQLSCHRWTKRIIGRSNIIIVVTDTVVQAEFFMFLRNIELNDNLGAICFDEVHTISEDQHYRPIFNKVFQLNLRTQYLCMTATFPPSMKNRFEFAMSFEKITPYYIRAPTHKPRMKYSVKRVPNESLEKESIAFISSESERFKNDDSKRKIMVFCPTKKRCDTLATILGCSKYYSNYVDKEKDLKAWKMGETNIIVCTGALGAGMDFDKVELVVHVDKPYGCMSFAQESGRAGRGGEDVESVMFVEEWLITKLKGMREMRDTDEAMREYIINESCLRIPLNKFLDGDDSGADCKQLNCRLCDHCEGTEAGRKRRLPSDFEQNSQYRKRMNSIKERQMEDESVQIYMMKTIDHLQSDNVCVYCFFHPGIQDYKHDSNECRAANFMWFPGEFKNGLKYEKNIVCYICSIPCDWCDGYMNHNCTRRMDVVAEVCGFAQSMYPEEVSQLTGMEFKTSSKYKEWLMKDCMIHDKKATNAFALFEKICRRRMKFI